MIKISFVCGCRIERGNLETLALCFLFLLFYLSTLHPLGQYLGGYELLRWHDCKERSILNVVCLKESFFLFRLGWDFASKPLRLWYIYEGRSGFEATS